MTLTPHKTKIVATIGPASESPETLGPLIRRELDVARLNFSHGDFSGHAEHIARIREAARAAGKGATIMADLPGPKIRLGVIDPEPIDLERGDALTLTSEPITGDPLRVSMSSSQASNPTAPSWSTALRPSTITVTGLSASCCVVNVVNSVMDYLSGAQEEQRLLYLSALEDVADQPDLSSELLDPPALAV